MVSRPSRDRGWLPIGFSRKQSPSASPSPDTAVVLSGAGSWGASGEPAAPGWLRGHSRGYLHSRQPPPLLPSSVMEIQVRCPHSRLQCSTPGRVSSGDTTVGKAPVRKEFPFNSKWRGAVGRCERMRTECKCNDHSQTEWGGWNVPEAGKHVASLRD